jgi:hypothetical protein
LGSNGSVHALLLVEHAPHMVTHLRRDRRLEEAALAQATQLCFTRSTLL